MPRVIKTRCLQEALAPSTCSTFLPSRDVLFEAVEAISQP